VPAGASTGLPAESTAFCKVQTGSCSSRTSEALAPARPEDRGWCAPCRAQCCRDVMRSRRAYKRRASAPGVSRRIFGSHASRAQRQSLTRSRPPSVAAQAGKRIGACPARSFKIGQSTQSASVHSARRSTRELLLP
jgi:hypothetical protein